MIKPRYIIIIILFLFIVSLAVSLTVIESKKVKLVDVVAINELVKHMEAHWGEVDQIDFSTIEEKVTILDKRGGIVYQSGVNQPTSIYDAIKLNYIIVDITVNEEIVGKLLLNQNDELLISQMKKQLSVIMIWLVSIVFSLLVICFFYFYIRIIKPFKKLQHFAAQIARGNLDFTLNMDKDNLFGAFTESFDIMREELAKARQAEYESNRSKKELVASLSHDIKTPVASIKAVSELMLLVATDEKITRQLNTIHTKAEQIDILISDMFHATMEELQELKVAVSEESSTVISDILSNMNENQKIIYEQIPACIILVDATRLQQIIDNVLSNAYKYGGTSVTIFSQIKHGFLQLDFIDNGKGIDNDELPLVFNKYFRGSNSVGKSGTGLGLYISHYFMHKMNGDIKCCNGQEGFTVTLLLKLA